VSQALTVEHPVGEWVQDDSARARVFEAYGIDYCCGGKKSLRKSCEEKGLETAAVLEALNAVEERTADARDWRGAPLSELCDHIESAHHVYLRQELPRLSALLEKVNRAHQDKHPELARLRTVLSALQDELGAHLEKEEQILFPLIRGLSSEEWSGPSHCGTIANPIRVMEMEHDGAGSALAEMRSLTAGYAEPADACPSYRMLLKGLHGLETDTHLHIHKENNILFPRALLRERELALRP